MISICGSKSWVQFHEDNCLWGNCPREMGSYSGVIVRVAKSQVAIVLGDFRGAIVQRQLSKGNYSEVIVRQINCQGG